VSRSLASEQAVSSWQRGGQQSNMQRSRQRSQQNPSSNILMLAIRHPLLRLPGWATCLNEQVIFDDLNV
jgi:hypothetical protein